MARARGYESSAKAQSQERSQPSDSRPAQRSSLLQARLSQPVPTLPLQLAVGPDPAPTNDPTRRRAASQGKLAGAAEKAEAAGGLLPAGLPSGVGEQLRRLRLVPDSRLAQLNHAVRLRTPLLISKFKKGHTKEAVIIMYQ